MRDLFHHCDAVLFDLDGTLVASSIDFTELNDSVMDHGRERNLPIPDERLDAISLIYFWEDSLNALGRSEEAARIRRETFQLMENLERPACLGASAIDGAADLLVWLRDNNKAIGIVTRNSRTLAEQMLAEATLPYDVVVAREDVPRCKPNPDHLLTALHQLSHANGLSDRTLSPDHTIMIGDHWTDAAGGNAAGITTIGLLLGRPDSIFAQARPTYVVNTLRDVLHAAHG